MSRARKKPPAKKGAPEVETETEERLMIRGKMFDQPGTSQPRRRVPSGVRAREAKLPGPSVRAERRAAERKATEAMEPPAMSIEEQLARWEGLVDSGELERRRANGTARKADGRRLIAGGRELVERIDRRTGELVCWQWKWRDELSSFENFQ
jgi:hypothetical protein